jgi:metal-responsive CopG/Arc/MetJ family transcriptional regulator
MPAKDVTVSLDEELLKIIDEFAKANFCTRSEYIRVAVIRRMKAESS